MARFLVAFEGQATGEWLFLALTAHQVDAELVAEQWVGSEVFDLWLLRTGRP